MNKRILSALMALILLALPLSGMAAPELGSVLREGIAQSLDAGKALVYEVSFESSLEKELGEDYATEEMILNDMQIRAIKQVVDGVQQANVSIGARGKEVLSLTLAGDSNALYTMSNLLGDHTLMVSYEQLAAMVRENLTSYTDESVPALQEFDPNLLLPYLLTVASWAGTKLVPAVEEGNVATEQHPDAVKKETITITSEDLAALVEEIATQVQADEALLAALTSEEYTAEKAQAEIAEGQSQLLTLIEGMSQPIVWTCLYDQEGTVLSQMLTLSVEEDGTSNQFEYEYHRNALDEGAVQETVDLVFIQGENAVRLYMTKGLETVAETETESEKHVSLLLGVDSMTDGQSASIRLETYAQVLTGVDTESIQLEIALTSGGAAYEQVFEDLGYEKPHDLYLSGSIESKRTEDGISAESKFTLALDTQIPLLTVNTVLSTQDAQEMISLENATDAFAMTEEESSSLLMEIIMNFSTIMAELEALYPELTTADVVG